MVFLMQSIVIDLLSIIRAQLEQSGSRILTSLAYLSFRFKYLALVSVYGVAQTATTLFWVASTAGLTVGSKPMNLTLLYFSLRYSIAAAVAVLHANTIALHSACNSGYIARSVKLIISAFSRPPYGTLPESEA